MCPPCSLPPSWGVASAYYPMVAALPTYSAPKLEPEDESEPSLDDSSSSYNDLQRNLRIPVVVDPFVAELLVLQSREISSSLVQVNRLDRTFDLLPSSSTLISPGFHSLLPKSIVAAPGEPAYLPTRSLSVVHVCSLLKLYTSSGAAYSFFFVPFFFFVLTSKAD